jgi:hypothetical protein
MENPYKSPESGGDEFDAVAKLKREKLASNSKIIAGYVFAVISILALSAVAFVLMRFASR